MNDVMLINFDDAKTMLDKAIVEHHIITPEGFKPFVPTYAMGYKVPIKIHRIKNRRKKRIRNMLKAIKLFLKRRYIK